VIGVNSSVRSLPFEGLDEFRIGFAVPSNTIEGLIPQLLVAVEVRRPWLGIGNQPISEELRKGLGIPEGIAIGRVWANSPAQSIGLEPFRTALGAVRGDIITTVYELVTYFNNLRPGHTVTLSVFRNMETVQIEATLAPWPDT